MVYLSESAPRETAEYLVSRGHTVETVRAGRAAGAVAAHPDVYMCGLGGKIVLAEMSEVGENYPENAAFCAAALDGYFIHNLKITAPRLLREAERRGLEPVHVNQGYAKCSCAVVDGKSVITADAGIARALSALGDIAVLEITPGHVSLPGHEYGFIGGASGRVGDEMLFCGDITAHPDFESIRAFIEARGVKIKWFDFPLLDVGTIIEA